MVKDSLPLNPCIMCWIWISFVFFSMGGSIVRILMLDLVQSRGWSPMFLMPSACSHYEVSKVLWELIFMSFGIS